MSAQDKKKDEPKKSTKVSDLLAQEELVSKTNAHDHCEFRARKTKPLRKS